MFPLSLHCVNRSSGLNIELSSWHNLLKQTNIEDCWLCLVEIQRILPKGKMLDESFIFIWLFSQNPKLDL